MAQGTFRAGKNSRAQANAQNMYAKQFSVTYRGEGLDVTHFEASGYEVGIIGILGLDWSLSADWDAGANALDDPPGLYPRSDGTNLKIYTNVSDNKSFVMASFRCFQSQIQTNARGTVSYSSSGASQGSFTVPAGST